MQSFFLKEGPHDRVGPFVQRTLLPDPSCTRSSVLVLFLLFFVEIKQFKHIGLVWLRRLLVPLAPLGVKTHCILWHWHVSFAWKESWNQDLTLKNIFCLCI